MNPDSSSEGSTDEEEVIKLFDKEAKTIVHGQTLPKKSADRYLLVYNTYKKWKDENKNSLSNCEENNLVVYFENFKNKLSSLTLWSVWSMLKKTLSTYENINIGNFLNLKSIIKANAKGHKPRKSFVLTWEQITKFMKEAPDEQYLVTKVVLIFGICGCLRCGEIINIKFEDIENMKNKYLVTISDNKNDYPGQFLIGDLFYNTVKKYILLRPPGKYTDRFFIHYAARKCSRSPIGRHTIGAMPKKIATYLELQNPGRYTGHCFRRSSATLLSNSGANMTMIKQLGRWRSDIIAQGYVENSLHNRQMIFNGITQNVITTDAQPQPSTSNILTNNEAISNQENIIEPAEEIMNLNWSDDEFEINNIELIPTEAVVDTGFTTGSNKPISVPKKSDAQVVKNHTTPFMQKPAIKLKFNNQLNVQPPPLKKPRKDEDSTVRKQENLSMISREHDCVFSNCTFNNCNINVTRCNCTKENP